MKIYTILISLMFIAVVGTCNAQCFADSNRSPKANKKRLVRPYQRHRPAGERADSHKRRKTGVENNYYDPKNGQTSKFSHTAMVEASPVGNGPRIRDLDYSPRTRLDFGKAPIATGILAVPEDTNTAYIANAQEETPYDGENVKEAQKRTSETSSRQPSNLQQLLNKKGIKIISLLGVTAVLAYIGYRYRKDKPEKTQN